MDEGTEAKLVSLVSLHQRGVLDADELKAAKRDVFAEWTRIADDEARAAKGLPVACETSTGLPAVAGITLSFGAGPQTGQMQQMLAPPPPPLTTPSGASSSLSSELQQMQQQIAAQMAQMQAQMAAPQQRAATAQPTPPAAGSPVGLGAHRMRQLKQLPEEPRLARRRRPARTTHTSRPQWPPSRWQARARR